MKIELKKVTVDGKALQLKVINQLQSLNVAKHQKVNCLGYYIVKKQKKYVFSTDSEIFTYIDYGWKFSHYSKTELAGNGNRYKHFNTEEDRDKYLIKINNLTDQLTETQLFY